ncbi:unnamed protein product [Chrysoparadoxa australica]
MNATCSSSNVLPTPGPPNYPTFGYSTLQLVESMNKANKPARLHGRDPLVVMLELAKIERGRYDKQR